MKYVDEYRNSDIAKKYIDEIWKITKGHWMIMEVCGGQTHTIIRFNIDEVLPKNITFIHGPGCPVCVTPIEIIDKAIAIASMKDVIFCSFGDMLRVPGSNKDLFAVREEGGDVRVVYSPIDALKIAINNPDKEVVFFGVGFETTAPANAMAIYQAKKMGVKNFSVLVSHVLVPPAIESILKSPNNRVNGFLAAGHVCTVMGYTEYEPIAKKYKVPIVVTGFEPLDILQGVLMVVKQLEEGRYEVENQYTRSVRREGNIYAQNIIKEVFEVVDRTWRGIGGISSSGLGIKKNYEEYDANKKFNLDHIQSSEPEECISGLVLQGVKKPYECKAFGTLCTPEHPLGAPMVSSEGACAAYYNYKLNKV
ncbi:MAG: hydrogenase formation protein HypD [Spirochaetia bacterium]|nr:hydrogenase formation protein HypD [Spirochaetota bacterium]MCX8096347.1 hydrogenase formation protein HypD [Spirochaetota bacterium]MDW8112292.1 hydrogenase formation protein HypD [Spirochaetia bacterium]